MKARISSGYTSSSWMPLRSASGSRSRAPARKPTAMPTPCGEIASGPMWTLTIVGYAMSASTTGHSCRVPARPRDQVSGGVACRGYPPSVSELTARARQWASTMDGHRLDTVRRAHLDSAATVQPGLSMPRLEREQEEATDLAPGATVAVGAGHRA